MTAVLPSLENRLNTVQGISYIKYLMEDVRVNYRRDIRAAVDDIVIDSKQGDISSVPRWIARILVEEQSVETQDSDNAIYISRAFNRERISKSHDISGLDADFYIRINDYIGNLNEKERENLLVSLNSFVATRLEKVVKLAAASPISAELKDKLSTEENQLYSLIHNSASLFRERVQKKVG